MNRHSRYVWSVLSNRSCAPLLVIALVAVFLLFPTAHLKAESPQELTVSAAASLKNVFQEIGALFESQRKGVKVHLNFASSGDLVRQIVGGAPVDVFASAAQREMDDLESRNLLVPDTRRPFARNEIVLTQPTKSTFRIAGFEDLKRPEVKMVGIGNPATVPAGLYASETLQHFNIWKDFKGKFIFGESVRQVLDYIARGEVDAGIVFLTDAKVRPNEVKVIATAPAGSHRPIIYPIALVKGCKNEKLGSDFIRFVGSEPARKVLEKYGFGRVK
jgi:molybdate transport system substrate-binding protein